MEVNRVSGFSGEIQTTQIAKKASKGFTLLEILVCCALIAIAFLTLCMSFALVGRAEYFTEKKTIYRDIATDILDKYALNNPYAFLTALPETNYEHYYEAKKIEDLIYNIDAQELSSVQVKALTIKLRPVQNQKAWGFGKEIIEYTIFVPKPK